jgi:hypothetical protein
MAVSGRRNHERYALSTPWTGSLTLLRDVMVHRDADGGLVAISQAPGIGHETMTLDLMGAGESVKLLVQVVDSRPIVIGGAVRHRLRLSVIGDPAVEAEQALSDVGPAAV